MFFTKTGIVLARLGFLIGVFGAVYGNLLFYGAIDSSIIDSVAEARHLKKEGYLYIAVSLVLGVLCEISTNQRADKSGKDEEA